MIERLRHSTVFRALRHRPFLLLWVGQSISRLGDSMYRLALVWWVLAKTGSALAMGTVLVFQTVPMVLFLLIGGVIVDRFDRLRIMIVSDVVRAAITAGMAISAYLGTLEIEHVYIASAIFGFVDAFFDPAYGATVPKVARHADLSSANSVTSLSAQVMRIAGPALCAICISVAGTSLVFAIDAATFVVSIAFLLALLRVPPTALSPSQIIDDDFTGLEMNTMTGFTNLGTGIGAFSGGTVSFVRPQDLKLDDQPDAKASIKSTLRKLVDEARAGFRLLLSKPYFWIPAVLTSVSVAFDNSAMSIAMPCLLTRILKLDVGAYGVIQLMSAAGFGLAALALGQRAKLRRRGRLLFTTALAIGLCSLAFAAPITIYGICAFVLIRALASGVFELAYVNVLQEKVPADKLGRVYAIDSFLSLLLMPIGLSAVGLATDRVDPRMIFLAVGLLGVVLSLGLRQRKIRKLS